MYAINDSAVRSEVMRKADMCASALVEARRLSGASMFGTLYAQLTAKITEMLDELDEALLVIDHTADRGAYERIAALHMGYEELEYRRGQIGSA
jgi:hypothetical protein